MTDDLLEILRIRVLAESGEARAIRLKLGLSLADLSRAVGSPISTVYRWETGQRVPHTEYGLRWGREILRLRRYAARIPGDRPTRWRVVVDTRPEVTPV